MGLNLSAQAVQPAGCSQKHITAKIKTVTAGLIDGNVAAAELTGIYSSP
jgi:hypothetical protein